MSTPDAGTPGAGTPQSRNPQQRARLLHVLLGVLVTVALVVIPLVTPNTLGTFTAAVKNTANSGTVMPFFSCREALTKESGRYFASALNITKPVNLVNNSTLTTTNVTAPTAASGCKHDATGYLTFAGQTTNPSTVAYQLPSGQTPPETYTQEMWMRTTTPSGNLMAMTNNVKYGSEDKQDRELYLGTGGQLFMTNYLRPSGAFEQVASSVSVIDGKWHHIIATRNSAAKLSSLYVDGKLAGSVATGGGLDVSYTTQFWRIGCSRSDGWLNGPAKSAECFKGDIAWAAAYSRAFTQQDVTNHYKAGVWGP